MKRVIKTKTKVEVFKIEYPKGLQFDPLFRVQVSRQTEALVYPKTFTHELNDGTERTVNGYWIVYVTKATGMLCPSLSSKEEETLVEVSFRIQRDASELWKSTRNETEEYDEEDDED